MFRRRKERKGLAKVLNALGDPQEAKATLKAMPADLARRLRDLLTLASQVSRSYREETARMPEPPGGLKAGRARLMAAVDELQASKQRRYRTQARWAMRFAGAVMAVVILIVPTGVYAFRASDDSLPGQALYPLKHSQESYMLRRTQEEPTAAVALTLTFANERIREMQALTEKGRPIPANVVTSVDVLTRRAIEAAAWSPEPLMETNLRIIAWHNQSHIHTLEALKTETADENQRLLSEAQTVLANRYLITEAARQEPDTFRSAYQAGEPERLATPGGGPLGTPEPTRVIDDLLKQSPTAAPTDLPTDTPYPTPAPSTTPKPTVTAEPAPAGPPEDVPGQPADPADPGEPGEPAEPADPNNPDTPPGQDNRPDDPPGQGDDPPGQGDDPPGQGDDPPGQGDDPPGQGDDPPGQGDDPPGQGDDPPGQGDDPPGQGDDPPGQGDDPPGKDKDKDKDKP
jgi:hypothetical protein